VAVTKFPKQTIYFPTTPKTFQHACVYFACCQTDQSIQQSDPDTACSAI